MPRLAEDLKLGAVPQAFALKWIEGRSVASRYPGGRVMYTATSGAKLFLSDEEASEFEHALVEQAVRPGDAIRVSRITHVRGGGFSIRVERDTPQAAPAASAHSWQGNAPATPAPTTNNVPQGNTPAPPAPAAPPAIVPGEIPSAMAEAMFEAVDAIIETQRYAAARGLGVTFSEESVRAIGLSIYIRKQHGGR
jgi:hypothetical protein